MGTYYGLFSIEFFLYVVTLRAQNAAALNELANKLYDKLYEIERTCVQ